MCHLKFLLPAGQRVILLSKASVAQKQAGDNWIVGALHRFGNWNVN